MSINTEPYFKNGKWWIDKDPDDLLYYFGNVSTWLTDSNTTAVSVVTIVEGVEVIEDTVIVNNTIMKVKLGGLDVTDDPTNFCTFRITCANGEQFDKTIWFKRVDG